MKIFKESLTLQNSTLHFPMNTKLSVVIITKNNEQIIRNCLESVKWADEIVIVDSGSVDQTIDICRQYQCKIVQSPWLGFGKTKQLAVANASYNWIFSIDTDETCSNELKEKIINIINSTYCKSGYKIKRRTYFLGKLIKYCGWQNDSPLRLFQKSSGNFNERDIHEYVVVDGEIEKIKELILHNSYPTLASFIVKMDYYTSLSAEEAYRRNKKSSPYIAILKCGFKFFKMYFLQLGFLDGIMGFLLAKNSAYGVLIKYLKIYEKQKKQ